MGCDCCKEINPNDYAKCKIANHLPIRMYIAPCGMDFSRGSNYTPPKKKRKRKKK